MGCVSVSVSVMELAGDLLPMGLPCLVFRQLKRKTLFFSVLTSFVDSRHFACMQLILSPFSIGCWRSNCSGSQMSVEKCFFSYRILGMSILNDTPKVETTQESKYIFGVF